MNLPKPKRIVHENNEPVLRKSPCQAGALVVIRKYRQARKHRHIGMDADIQAMDGNHPTDDL